MCVRGLLLDTDLTCHRLFIDRVHLCPLYGLVCTMRICLLSLLSTYSHTFSLPTLLSSPTALVPRSLPLCSGLYCNSKADVCPGLDLSVYRSHNMICSYLILSSVFFSLVCLVCFDVCACFLLIAYFLLFFYYYYRSCTSPSRRLLYNCINASSFHHPFFVHLSIYFFFFNSFSCIYLVCLSLCLSVRVSMCVCVCVDIPRLEKKSLSFVFIIIT